MRIFLTGATGFIGSAIIPELIGSGHQVLGLTRSDAGAEALVRAGARAHRGDLEDMDSLRAGAAMADAVIHAGFNHDFSKYVENCEADRRVIEALGSVLAGSDRPLIITSGTAMAKVERGAPATETDAPAPSKTVPRAASEEAAAAVAARGGRVMVVRLAQIHDTTKQGMVSPAIELARQKRISAYVGDGLNRWPAAHRLDTARLYRLVLEKGAANARYHAVAEAGVSMREIAEVIGQILQVPVVSLAPEEAARHFGWLAPFAGWDMPASNTRTREQLGWNPTGPSLLADLRNFSGER
jgi:nucleoside-diphosphate-sugar epimerase